MSFNTVQGVLGSRKQQAHMDHTNLLHLLKENPLFLHPIAYLKPGINQFWVPSKAFLAKDNHIDSGMFCFEAHHCLFKLIRDFDTAEEWRMKEVVQTLNDYFRSYRLGTLSFSIERRKTILRRQFLVTYDIRLPHPCVPGERLDEKFAVLLFHEFANDIVGIMPYVTNIRRTVFKYESPWVNEGGKEFLALP
jgi:hypothetical protein